MKKISTSALSRNLELTSKELFDKMVEEKLIYRNEEKWNLTKKGKEFGGETTFNKKFGEFIVWPGDFNPFDLNVIDRKELINATAIGKHFSLSNQRVNLVFAEIGWTEKAIKGWSVTSLGRKVGGVQFEHSSGGTYVNWPKEILSNKTLLKSLNNKNDVSSEDFQQEELSDYLNEFRKKFPANYRTKDGHLVRSRAEVIIDNALYDYGLAHAYERRLPIEEDVFSDFYIPSKKGTKAVYIEFWGLEDDPYYQERKRIKKEAYAKYDLNLIELSNQHVENLDDHLPKLFLRFGINVE